MSVLDFVTERLSRCPRVGSRVVNCHAPLELQAKWRTVTLPWVWRKSGGETVTLFWRWRHGDGLSCCPWAGDTETDCHDALGVETKRRTVMPPLELEAKWRTVTLPWVWRHRDGLSCCPWTRDRQTDCHAALGLKKKWRRDCHAALELEAWWRTVTLPWGFRQTDGRSHFHGAGGQVTEGHVAMGLRQSVSEMLAFLLVAWRK